MCSRIVCACAMLALTVNSAWAVPAINNLSLRGLQAGATTTLVIDGEDLLPDSQLLTSLAGVKATVKPGAQPARLELDVAVDASASPGIYTLRVANKNGVSNAVLVSVDGLPQLPGGAKSADMPLAALPVAIAGNLAGSEADRFTFPGTAGQRLVIDVEARRLGANFNPVVRLYDARGTQVAFGQGLPRLAGDVRVVTTLKTAGAYTIELHDLAYKAAAPGYYRLKVGDLQFADFALPAGVTAGTKAAIGFASSSLPPNSQSQIEIPAGAVPESSFAVRPATPLLTGQAPQLFVSDGAELLATPPAEKPQELPAQPVAVSGVIAATGEEDRFLVPVTPGAKLRLDVLAARLGSPLDGVLTIAGEQGNQLATDDDEPGTSDPGLEFTVPAGVNKLLLKVSDHQRASGPDYVYRLMVRDTARPAFALTLERDRVNVASGSVQVLRVDAARAGYAGPIKLEVQNLPAGLQVSGDEIPTGANFTLLSFVAPPGASGSGLVSIVGRAAEVQPPLARRALTAETPTNKLAPWLRQEVGVGVTGAPRLTAIWNAAADEKLPLGGKYTAKIQLTRSAAGKGPVRFTMLTTQPPVKKKEKKDNKEVEVDDIMQMLRLENPPELGPDDTAATLTVAIPAELAAQPWGLAFTAELLDAEKKVTASATTGMKFLPAVKP